MVEAWLPNDTEAVREHRLNGLEPDNLLAFMALIGLLRALETARPGWRPRAFWDVENHPWRPVLTLAEPRTQATVAEAAAEGVKALVRAHAVTGDDKNVKFEIDAFRDRRAAAADPNQGAVLDALSCDAAIKDDKTLWPTPFCFVSGQGHQHFLTRFREVPKGVLPKALAKKKPPPDLNSPTFLAKALFRVWMNEDHTDSFRWDPAEDRRYALRAKNPSKDATTTEHGANVLAAIALPLFPVFAVARRGEARVLSPSTCYDGSGQIAFSWPIWTRAASLDGLRALLAHRALTAAQFDGHAMPSVAAVFRARRVSVGEYSLNNVTPAQKVGTGAE